MAKLVVILGGDGRGKISPRWPEPVSRYCRAVVLIGRDAQAMGAVLEGVTQPGGDTLAMQAHASLEEATRWAFTQARAGDAVLLSPACASLDMFRNYAHRAQVFIDTVRELGADQGEMV